MPINLNHLSKPVSKPVVILAKSLIALIFISATLWYSTPAMFNRKSDYRATILTLKMDACSYLKHEGISIHPIPDLDAVCSVSVSFNPNAIGIGGVIHFGDRRIRIADNQVVSAEATADPAQAEEASHDLNWILLSTCFMLGMLGWLIII